MTTLLDKLIEHRANLVRWCIEENGIRLKLKDVETLLVELEFFDIEKDEREIKDDYLVCIQYKGLVIYYVNKHEEVDIKRANLYGNKELIDKVINKVSSECIAFQTWDTDDTIL